MSRKNVKHNKKILILEDEVDLNEMISMELENKGYETIKLYNPKNFKEIFAKEKPDILITDLKLPEIPGKDIIQMTKQIDVSIPPIIAMTAYNDILPQTLYNLGVESVIYKPFQLVLLTNTIDRLCIPLEERLQLSIEKYGLSPGWVRKIDNRKINEIILGRGGFSFKTNERIETNEIIEFSIKVLEEVVLDGKGIVRWDIINKIDKNETTINKYGVEFVYLNDKSRECFISFISNNIISPYIPYLEN